MFDDLGSIESTAGSERDVLAELEGNSGTHIQSQGGHFRVRVKAKLTLMPGNASERFERRVDGISHELTDQGINGLFTAPLRVGDVYRLNFDRSALDLPSMFALCVSCRIIQEDAYENSFDFFTPVALPDSMRS